MTTELERLKQIAARPRSLAGIAYVTKAAKPDRDYNKPTLSGDLGRAGSRAHRPPTTWIGSASAGRGVRRFSPRGIHPQPLPYRRQAVDGLRPVSPGFVQREAYHEPLKMILAWPRAVAGLSLPP